MSFLHMSGGARLLWILRRAHEVHGGPAYLSELRSIASTLIEQGCISCALEKRSGACPQRSEDSRRGALRRVSPRVTRG